MFYTIEKTVEYISDKYKYVNGTLLALFITALIVPFTFPHPITGERYTTILLNTPECFVEKYTGKECSSCGLTRTFSSIYHGEIGLSKKYNQNGMLILSVIIFETILRVIYFFSKNKWKSIMDIGHFFILWAIFGFLIF